MTPLTWTPDLGRLGPASGVGSEAAVRGLPEENLALLFLSGCFQNNSPTRPCPLETVEENGSRPWPGTLKIGKLPFVMPSCHSGLEGGYAVDAAVAGRNAHISYPCGCATFANALPVVHTDHVATGSHMSQRCRLKPRPHLANSHMNF